MFGALRALGTPAQTPPLAVGNGAEAHPATKQGATGAPQVAAPAAASAGAAAAAASGAAVAPESVAGLDMLPRIQNKKDSEKGGASKELASRYSNTCRYCMRRLGHSCRLRCDVCPDDFELCIECFSAGVEIDGHRTMHPYRVSQNLDFPIFGEDWTAAEELTLLDSMHEKGLGNWDESVKVRERSPLTAGELSDHYYDVYLGRYGSVLPARYLRPLPQGAYEWAEVPEAASRGIGAARPAPAPPVRGTFLSPPNPGNFPAYSPPVRGSFLAYSYPPTLAGWGPEGPVEPPAALAPRPGASASEMFAAYAAAAAADAAAAAAASAAEAAAATAAASGGGTDAAGGSAAGAASGAEAGSSSAAGGAADSVVPVASTPLHGYMPHRGDFDTEFENDAELLLADMEINPTDHPAERQLKLEVIGIYNRKLDERDKRKQFAKDWGLLDLKKLQAVDRKRTREERETVARLRSVARAHGAQGREEHDKTVEGVLRMRRIVRRLEQLQDYHSKGIRTLAEADLWETERRRRGDENYSSEKRRRAENPYSAFGGNGRSARDRSNRHGRDSANSAGGGAPSTAAAAAADVDNDGIEALAAAALNGGDGLAATQANGGGGGASEEAALAAAPAAAAAAGGGGAPRISIAMGPGSENLTPPERELCTAVNLLPRQYLIAKDAVIRGAYFSGHLHKNSARELVQLDVTKSDSVYDFIVSCGWLNSEPGSAPPQPAPPEPAPAAAAAAAAPARGRVPAAEPVAPPPERTVAI